MILSREKEEKNQGQNSTITCYRYTFAFVCSSPEVGTPQDSSTAHLYTLQR